MKKIALNLGFALVLALVGTSVSAQSAGTFNVSLSYGSANKAEVTNLQNFLISQGFLKVAATGSFLSMTKQAVIDFQIANNITPASGYFGPITREVANRIVASGGEVQKATINIESVTEETQPGAVVLSAAKTVRWRTVGYPMDAGININLLRRVSDSPVSYELVRVIARDTINDSTETWIPRSGENTNDLYIEVACSDTYRFRSGCQFTSSPIKI